MQSSPRSRTPSWLAWVPAQMLLAVALVSLAPAVYAIHLAHQSRFVLATAVAIPWIVGFWVLLVQLHNRNLARLVVTVPVAVGILAAAQLVFAMSDRNAF
jgi:hypothetical protein